MAYNYAYMGFVALDIFGGVIMGIVFWLRLCFKCFRLAGWFGLKACFRFMTGRLQLPDSILRSYGFAVGGSDA